KTYVREGFGIGVIADLAYDPQLDGDLGRRDLSHLFPWEVTRIAQARSKYPRTFQRAFMELFQREVATLVRERQQGE
ncbi:MAG: HTH-type transcriptional regulator CysB, partial [Chromatiaceae bacterium]|nr:HTH-type transcriptional regulator CysB [Chromatiaceae bacterium]